MHNDNRFHAIAHSLIGGIAFAAYAGIVALQGPWEILLGAAAFGLLVGIVSSRTAAGKIPVPPAAGLALSLLAMALYTWAFFFVDRPTGVDWVAVLLVFAFPILLLGLVFTRSSGRAE